MDPYEERVAQDGDVGVWDVSLDDGDILKQIRKPIEESKDYWDNTFGLKKAREDNMNLWLPNHYKGMDVYDYQESSLYQDNRIFTSVETITAVVNSRIAQPEVDPAQDTVTSYQLAKDLGKVLFAHSAKYQTPDIWRIAARSLLLKRVGWVKLRWDPLAGKNGDIVPEHVMPEDIIVDRDAKWNEVPRFVTQILRGMTGEELVARFPDSKQKIYAMLGCERRNGDGDLIAVKTQLAKRKDIYETWFQYYDDKAKKYCSGVCWTDTNFNHVLASIKNPNWNYEKPKGSMDEAESEEMSPADSNYVSDDDSQERENNFLDYPEPPFIPLNFLNDGSSYIDLTSYIEQAAPLQRILDRRGFQIMDNADQAGSGMIYNTNMIDKEEISNLIGAPDERVGVAGDVRSAVARVAPPPLPDYVLQDKMDARDAIDNIFATHNVTRGDNNTAKTLGQDKLQLGQDNTRMEEIARAVERANTKYYRMLVQMMKVYYDEDHYYRAVGEDGQFDFIIMRADLIEDGIDVNVAAGSTLPVNKESQREATEFLAQLGLVDPLTLYEVVGGAPLPSPKKMFERLMLFKADPAGLLQKVADEEFDRSAFMDAQILLAGSMPEMRDEYPPVYFDWMNKYMTSGDYLKQPEQTKARFTAYVEMAKAQAMVQMEALMTQLPTQDEMMNANQQALGQAQMEGQMMNDGPQSAVPTPEELAKNVVKGGPQPPQPGPQNPTPPQPGPGGNPGIPQQAPPLPPM